MQRSDAILLSGFLKQHLFAWLLFCEMCNYSEFEAERILEELEQNAEH